MKEEALQLAKELDSMGNAYTECIEASAMIRRLVEELDKWEKDLHLQSHVLGFMEGKASQAEEHMMLQQPLSEEELLNIWWDVEDDEALIKFARAIEERHGIK